MLTWVERPGEGYAVTSGGGRFVICRAVDKRLRVVFKLFDGGDHVGTHGREEHAKEQALNICKKEGNL